MTWLSLAFMATTFVVFAIYGAFAATMRRQVISRPQVMAWLRRTFAATHVVLAGRLASTAARRSPSGRASGVEAGQGNG